MARPSPRQAHDRFPYSAIVDRPQLRWPNGARLAVWIIPNIEHFLFDRPSTPITHATLRLVPDVLNYSWRDYGVRVGIWRLIDVMEQHGFKGTVALNSDVCRHIPASSRPATSSAGSGWGTGSAIPSCSTSSLKRRNGS